MNLYWAVKPAMGKRDANCGSLVIHNSRRKKNDWLDESCFYPLNKWGTGYWYGRHKQKK